MSSSTKYVFLYKLHEGCLKKTGICVQRSFKDLKWPKMKKQTRKQTPPKIQFYLLGSRYKTGPQSIPINFNIIFIERDCINKLGNYYT